MRVLSGKLLRNIAVDNKGAIDIIIIVVIILSGLLGVFGIALSGPYGIRIPVTHENYRTILSETAEEIRETVNRKENYGSFDKRDDLWLPFVPLGRRIFHL